MILEKYFLLFLIMAQLVSVQSWAEPDHISSIMQIKKQVEQIQVAATNQHLLPSSVGRAPHCPIEGQSFRGIADQMALISSSLVDGKCYEKHSKEIGEINRLSRKLAEEELDISPSENGSFVDSEKGIQIQITNQQTQSVQNTNSILGGLFEISKDKDCIESMKKSGKLASIAEVLTRFGTLGMFYPSTLGTLGGAMLIGTGASLLILDNLITPEFRWNYQQDRKDFLALTCAFYNLRTELHQFDFFDSSVSDIERKMGKIDGLLSELQDQKKNVVRKYSEWKSYYHSQLNEFCESKLSRGGGEKSHLALYFLVREGLDKLRSYGAQGRSVSDRFELRNYFLNRKEKLFLAMKQLDLIPVHSDRVIQEVNGLIDLSTDEVLMMSHAKWVGRMLGIRDSLEQLSQYNFIDTASTLDEFEKTKYEMTVSFHEADQQANEIYTLTQDQIQDLIVLLEQKQKNLVRKRRQSESLAGWVDGSQSEYDIYRELGVIKQTVLGKKGWSLIDFLLRDSRKKLSQFSGQIPHWISLSAQESERKWSCREAHDLVRKLNHSQSGINLAQNFLSANDDLWSDYDSMFRKVYGIPIGFNYAYYLYSAAKSSEIARGVIQFGSISSLDLSNALRDIRTYSSFFSENFGILMVDLHQASVAYRSRIESFIEEKCDAHAMDAL
jgi:hypothetical protein